MEGKRSPRWSKAQRAKFRQTMIVKRGAKAIEEAETEFVRAQRPHNPFRDLHETLDAYFQHLGLEDKIDVIRQVVGLTKK